MGGNDTITTGTGRDTILGGAGNDTITSNRGVGGDPTVDSSDIVLGDHGFVDSVLRDGQATDLDRIWSTDTDLGGNDLIRTGEGDDVVVAGVGNDTVDAGNGLNVVIGDSGRITSAVQDTARRGALPMTLGRVETVDPTLGGSDTILTGSGSDIVLGGAAGDTISTDTNAAVDATDIVLGDHGYLDFVADLDATDIDAIVSTDVDLGGNDVICTGTGSVSANMAASCGGSLPGDGADVVFGGAGDDTVFAGTGHNIVLGDNGSLTAYDAVTARWGTLPMSPQTLVTLASAADGNDVVTTLSGVDVVLGGNGDDFARLGAGTDTFVGDRAEVTWAVPTTNNPSGTLQVVKVQVIDNTVGGADLAYGEADDDLLVGGTRDDDLDGGSGRDLVIGDNAVLDRTTRYGVYTSPRFRTLLTPGGAIYSTALATAGTAQVDGTSRLDPRGNAVWADYVLTLVDHAVGTDPLRYGGDYLAGGAEDDLLFGQLGNDTIQGDGNIDNGAYANRGSNGLLTINVGTGTMLASDGDDYIEGGGGNDVVFGDVGQDDIIGGSSDLFGLTTSKALRPDGTDLLFGGAGTSADRNNQSTGHGTDSDTIVGDNGRILRLVGATGAFLGFTYDVAYTPSSTVTNGDPVRLLPRAVTLLDYTPGGPDREPTLFPSMNQNLAATYGAMTVDICGADEIHGEAGDDIIYAGGGNDVVYGDAGDDDIIGGWGNDWISGGTGQDGVLGDDGRIFTSRNGLAEPLNGVDRLDASTAICDARPATRPRRSTSTGALNKTVDLTPFDAEPAHHGELQRRPAVPSALRRRHHLRRPRQRLPARRLRRRRDLRRRGAGRVRTRRHATGAPGRHRPAPTGPRRSTRATLLAASSGEPRRRVLRSTTSTTRAARSR